MKAIRRRLRRLEESHLAQKNEPGLTPVDVLRQRRCRRLAKETGRPYEELLREDVMKSKAFWASFDGDRSIAGILRITERWPMRRRSEIQGYDRAFFDANGTT
jgi:hypothetical protein